MKVLLQNRSSFRNAIAGDGIQMLKTQEYLRKLQVETDTSSDPEVDLRQYDLIHLFNLMPVDEIFPLYQNAHKQNKKIVLSSIYWNPAEFFYQSKDSEHLKLWWEKTMPLRNEILQGVDMILPNSEMEWVVLKKQFSSLPPAMIVVNGVDITFSRAKPEHFVARYQWQNYLLSVGRICKRKNQLALIKAARDLKMPLVLIGPLNDGTYYQECRRAAAGHQVLFIDRMSQRDLASAYAAARVHALVSWYDTPGLVSLEAALAGCRVVTTVRGSTREYFGDLVSYCNPANDHSIRQALENVWYQDSNPEIKHQKKNQQLKNHILEYLTWEKTAEQTLAAYKNVLGET